MRHWLVDGGLLDLVTLHPLWSGLIVLILLFALRAALRGASRRRGDGGSPDGKPPERRRGMSDRL